MRELARAGAQVTGCDFSMSALAVAQAKIGRLNGGARADLIQGDAQSLPFRSESFDLIVSCETIEHVHIDERDCTYLFKDENGFTFMDKENFEQLTVPILH